MKEFKPGDIVRLKSGGRDMTVGYQHGDSVTCYYDCGHGIDVHEIPVCALSLVGARGEWPDLA